MKAILPFLFFASVFAGVIIQNQLREIAELVTALAVIAEVCLWFWPAASNNGQGP